MKMHILIKKNYKICCLVFVYFCYKKRLHNSLRNVLKKCQIDFQKNHSFCKVPLVISVVKSF